MTERKYIKLDIILRTYFEVKFKISEQSHRGPVFVDPLQKNFKASNGIILISDDMPEWRAWPKGGRGRKSFL